MPKVFVLIPLYNSEKYIVQTIESVLAQSYEDWECLILDDCSADNSYQIAKKFEQKDKRISVLQNKQNLGMMANWNEGIKFCKTEYFVKLDADDLWHPDMLQESVKVLDTLPEVALVFSKYINIDNEGREISDSEITLPDFARNKAFSCLPLVQKGAGKMMQYNILRQGLSIIRRKVFDEIGFYRYLLSPETQASTDTEFYFRVGCHYQIYCLDKTYYFYRVHPDSISANDKQEDLHEQKMYEVKKVIMEYYFKKGKISRKLYEDSQMETEFLFNNYRIYRSRVQKKYFRMLGLMLQNFYLSPFKFLGFYWSRIFKRNG